MKSRSTLRSAAAAIALAASAFPALAVQVYNLNSTQVVAFGAPNYGTVTLTQNGANVDFNVTLAPNFNFVTTGGPHDLFAFNGTGVSIAEIVNMSVAGGGTLSAHVPGADQPFGTFGFGIDCAACVNGAPGQQADPLTFRVLNALESDFSVLSTGGTKAYFAADVINGAGATGAVGSVTAPVPEPESYALMLAGLGMMGFMAKRRRVA